MRVSSSDEQDDDDDERLRELVSDAEEEDTRVTRPARNTRRGGARLSTSESDESDSDLASDLLDNDSDSEGHGTSSSSEYSDWTAEAGVGNLEPPKRNRRKVYRRPRCLSSEGEVLILAQILSYA